MVFRISKGNVITHEKEIEESDLAIPNEEGMEKELIDPKNVIFNEVRSFIKKIVATCQKNSISIDFYRRTNGNA